MITDEQLKEWRHLSECNEADWCGDDRNECPRCYSAMHLSEPDLEERRGLCSRCASVLNDAVGALLDEVERLRSSVECLEIARADVAQQLDEMTRARDEACGELEDTGGEFAIARAVELRKVGPKLVHL